jgi:hypothetical protein
MALSVHTSSFLSKLSLVVPSVVTLCHTNLIIFVQINGHTIWIHSCDFKFQYVGATDVDEWIGIIVSVLVRPSVWLSCKRAVIKLVTFVSVQTHLHMWVRIHQICRLISLFVSLKRWVGWRIAINLCEKKLSNVVTVIWLIVMQWMIINDVYRMLCLTPWWVELSQSRFLWRAKHFFLKSVIEDSIRSAAAQLWGSRVPVLWWHKCVLCR